MKQYLVESAQTGQRLDVVAANWLGLNRSQVTRAIRRGEILLNAQAAKPGAEVAAGDHLSYQPSATIYDLPKIPVIYEDDDLVVVDKPAGLSVHPTSAGDHQATLADFAAAKTTDQTPVRPGIVHRLDKDTSGLVIIAKTLPAKTFLQAQFRTRRVEKEYLALVEGNLPKAKATINLPIGSGHSVKRVIEPSGRAAVTNYEVIKRYPTATLVAALPATGRTHQLRVHFAAIGHPIIGDSLYGRPEPDLKRHFLHAHKLAFTAPSGQRLELTSALPKSLQTWLKTLA